MENYSISFLIEIFPITIILIYAESLEDCSKIGRVSYELDIHYDKDCLAVTQGHGTTITIALPHSVYIKDPSILVHETLHAACKVLQIIGDGISNNVEEVLCYVQQHIYKKCVEQLNKIEIT